MNVTIPLYVEERKPDGSAGGSVFVVRPLFFSSPVESNVELNRAVSRMAGLLRNELDGLGRTVQQQALADWTFSPAYEEKTFKFELPLKRQTVRCKLLAVSFEAGQGWGVTEEFLRASFAEPVWVDTEIEQIEVAAELGDQEFSLRGFLLRAVRAFER